MLYFSESIASIPWNSSMVELVECGDDNTCSDTDPVIARYDLSRWAPGVSDKVTSNVTNFTVNDHILDLDLEAVEWPIHDGGWYVLKIPADSIYNYAGVSLAALEIPFVWDKKSTFDHTRATLLPTTGSSTEQSFHLELSAGTDAGAYRMCYCDESEDPTLVDYGLNDFTFVSVRDGHSGTDCLPVWSHDNTTVGTRLLSEHKCVPKCEAGCVGSDCFCHESDSDLLFNDVYCLNSTLCRDACEALDECVAVATYKTQCVLFDSMSDCNLGQGWKKYEKRFGTACTHASDFNHDVGKLTVTKRADVGVRYVVTPNTPQSIEVTGKSLTYDLTGGLTSKDRIMVIDGEGMCGYSDATEYATTEAGSWSELRPWSYFSDRPHDDDENEDNGMTWFDSVVLNTYAVTAEDTFCINNIDLDGLKFPSSGLLRDVAEHSCYSKCITSDCEGDDCYCDGALAGLDSDSSNSLCANQTLCQYICDNVDGCTSIDMHKALPRCYLNIGSCNESAVGDIEYQVLSPTRRLSRDEILDDPRLRRLSIGDPTRHLRSLLARQDLGYSFSELLRFKPINFLSGGTFKVCFCDSALLDKGESCYDKKDFPIEVGVVHASGIQCLLEHSMYARHECVGMEFGGLRCYENMPPNTDGEDELDLTPHYLESQSADTMLYTSWCALHPEEQACSVMAWTTTSTTSTSF